MPTLLWFRRDLRLQDLPALLDAAEADGEVLACYVLDPRLKAASRRRRLQYLYDALREMHDALGDRLMVTRGRPEKRIPALAKAVGATSVHVSADFSPFGRRRDDACPVQSKFAKSRLSLRMVLRSPELLCESLMGLAGFVGKTVAL